MLACFAKLIFRTFLFLVVLLAAIIVLPGLPPHIEFEYTPRPMFVPFEGVLTPNKVLDNAELLFKGAILGPESLVVDGKAIYTGLDTGEIIKIQDGKFSTVARLGRPAGMRLSKSGESLFVADFTAGISKVNIKTGAVQVIAPKSVAVDGKPSEFPDDLDVDSNGIIYYSDATSYGYLGAFIFELLGAPSGRIIKFDPVTKSSSVIDDKLHFANGVQLTPDESSLLYCETLKHRILRHHLKGNNAGKTEVFTKLPGSCDNIRVTSRGTYYVGIVTANFRDEDAYLGESPWLRKLILRTLSLVKLIAGKVGEIYKNSLSEDILSGEILIKFGIDNYQSYGLAVELDENGVIINSYHSPTGKVGMFSDVMEHGEYLYLGGYHNPYLARVPLHKLR